MLPKPVILLAFANPEYEGQTLQTLKDEIDGLRQVLDTDAASDRFEVKTIFDADVDKVLHEFGRKDLRDRIVAFHYGGHAGSKELMLAKGAVDAAPLADFLGTQPLLQLVVLNGCATQGQVDRLLQGGIRRVIATTRAIDDRQATHFALALYRALAAGLNIEKAYAQAIAAVQMKYSESAGSGSLDFAAFLQQAAWELHAGTSATDGTPLSGGFFLAQQLRSGSRRYHDQLRGKGGRFFHLHITDLLLTQAQPAALPALDAPVLLGGQNLGRLESLPWLWQQETPHCLVIGDGGMGKTVSLLRLWQQLLDQDGPIPVFVALNEFNHTPEDQRQQFLSRYLARHCLGEAALTPETTNALWQWLEADWDRPYPKLILLLDGFNEITVDPAALLADLQSAWRQKTQGLQILLSSRYESNYTWTQGFHRMELQPLSPDIAQAYLAGKNRPWPADPRMQQTLLNPMMLTLYAETSEQVQAGLAHPAFAFKMTASRAGEIFWNFVEAQVARYAETYAHQPAQAIHYRWLLRHLLPLIGFEMERQGLYSFRRNELKTLIEQELAGVAAAPNDYFEVFPNCESVWDALESGNTEALTFASLRDQLSETLRMLKKEEMAFSFLHQHFRDFFAAAHICNELRLAMYRQQAPEVLRDRVLPKYLRQMLGEITGEHHSAPRFDAETRQWRLPPVSPTLLQGALDRCRGLFGEEKTGRMVWNLVQTCAEVRGELSGADLRNLDLQQLVFNGIRLSRPAGEAQFAARFAGARLRPAGFFPQNHPGVVTCAAYDPQRQALLTGYLDGTVLMQDLNSYQQRWRIRPHARKVIQVAVDPAGAKGLSISEAGEVCTWRLDAGEVQQALQLDMQNRLTGITRSVFEKVQPAIDLKGNGVLECMIHPDLSTVCATCTDGTLRILSIDTGVSLHVLTPGADDGFLGAIVPHTDGAALLSENAQLYRWMPAEKQFAHLSPADGHEGAIQQIAASPDGSRALTGDGMGIICEWEIATATRRHRLQFNDKRITALAYAPDGKRAASGHADGWICEWDLATGQQLRAFLAHWEALRFLFYLPGSPWLASGGFDDRICQWDMRSGTLVHSFEGYNHIVRSLDLNPGETQLAWVSENREIALWNLETRHCQAFITHPQVGSWGLRYAHAGRQLVNSGNYNMLGFWDAFSGEYEFALRIEGEQISDLDTWGEGTQVLFALDSIAYVIDTSKQEMVNGLQLPTHIKFLKWSPDGRIAALTAGKALYVWDLVQQQYFSFDQGEHSKDIYAMAFDPAGKRLFSGDFDGRVCLFDCMSISLIKQLNTGLRIAAICLSADESSLIIGEWYSGKLYRFDLKTGECLQNLQPYPEKSTIRILRPYGTDRILSCSDAGELCVWESDLHTRVFSLPIAPGMGVQGIDLHEAQWLPEISVQDRALLAAYGADL